jgi:hypothetical protein
MDCVPRLFAANGVKVMSLETLWTWLENLPLAMRIGESWWFPLLESLHVVGVTFVFGSLLMVDLRLIGVAGRDYAISRVAKELVPWTWAAFTLSLVTGLGLFITRADHYAGNIAFQLKMLALLLAGINMLVFHFGVFRSVAAWDAAATTPTNAKAAGALSLLLWMAVMLAGRWVGHLN